MRYSWRPALRALALVLLLALAACSDKDSGDSTSPGANTTAEANSPGRQALDSLRQFAEGLGQTTYKLVYDLTGTDTRSGKVDATLTLAAEPPKQKLGLTGEIGGKQGSIVLLDDGSASYVCVDMGGQQGCLKGKTTGQATMPMPALANVDQLINRIASDSGATVKPAKDQRIAGKKAKCWDVEGSEGKGQFCLGEGEGVLLLIDGTFTGARLTLRAKEVGTPAASDFTPPYKVVTALN